MNDWSWTGINAFKPKDFQYMPISYEGFGMICKKGILLKLYVIICPLTKIELL